MNTKGQVLCAWSGILSIVVFFAGWWPLAGFLPPISPAWEAQQIADAYLGNAAGIRFAAICFLYSASLLVLFYAGISAQLKRIEGEFGPMSIAQIALGVLAVVPFIPAAVSLCVATFRPERDIADILLFSDFTWILFLMVAPPAMFQFFTIGYAILSDRGSRPVFPRWLGFFTFWCAILSTPSVIIVFFKSGPFAWSGLFGFWIPATVFGVWTIAMAVMLLKAIKQEALGR